ncbi:MAG: DUF4330 domain-containing protein [Synechococcales cyanobacterium]
MFPKTSPPKTVPLSGMISLEWFEVAMIDSKGRLFGKVSLIDLGAVALLVVALAVVFLLPGQQATSVVQIGQAQPIPVEVDMIARGISARSIDIFQIDSKANLIIRNQPYGQVTVKKVENVSRVVPLVFPDGEVRRITDTEAYRLDVVLTLAGSGQRATDGIVLGNNKVKIGVPLEIETETYNVRGTVMDVRVPSVSVSG